MKTIPTVVVHGGAGTYASITLDIVSKEDIENGRIIILESLSSIAPYSSDFSCEVGW